MVNVVQSTVQCKYAEEFLDALSPLGPQFQGKQNRNNWLFRGQGGDYPLIPSAFRKDRVFASLTQWDLGDPSQFLLAERDILTQFFDIADKRGLVLPDDTKELRSALETLKSDRGDRFSSDSEWHIVNIAPSLTALAQHYGIPTRLLDWSRQSYIAAFFAAESALKVGTPEVLGIDASSNLVVWAFHFPFLGKHDAVRQLTDPVRIVTAPSATNPNLKAQQGVFTFINPESTKKKKEYPALDRFLEDLAADAEPENSDADRLIVDCKIQKFSLPKSEAKRLLYLLAKWDITPSAIYPGYHSIITDIRMQKDW